MANMKKCLTQVCIALPIEELGDQCKVVFAGEGCSNLPSHTQEHTVLKTLWRGLINYKPVCRHFLEINQCRILNCFSEGYADGIRSKLVQRRLYIILHIKSTR
jgi:hypothetical protein